MNKLIEGVESSEAPTLDIKGPCSWNKGLIKDILAFSNVQDGGHIIIGIEDRTFERLGLDEAQIESFDEEKIQDIISNYADPHVELKIFNNIIDENDKKYVIIKVYEFSEVPTVCSKDGEDVVKGGIYFRSRTGRPSSRVVSNSNDMHDILNRATVKMMQKRTSQGYNVGNLEVDSALEDELGGM